MKLEPCKHCGYDDKTEVEEPSTKQRYAQQVCQNCHAGGPRGINELESIIGWNSDGNYIPKKPRPSKCCDCGWNGDNSLIKDMRPNDKTVHWTCPQCHNQRVTLGEPINKVWG